MIKAIYRIIKLLILMKIQWIGVFLTLIVFTSSKAQSYRGIHVLNDSSSWISGSQGQVLRFKNEWIKCQPLQNQYSTKDFRDIHAWNENIAIVMSAGDSGVILRTTNEGKNWNEVFSDYRNGIFFDALEFSNQNPELGILIGDPINDKTHFYGLFTLDSGKTWHEFPPEQWNSCNNSMSSFFAASGSSFKITSSKKENDTVYSIELIFAGHGDSATEIRIAQIQINKETLKVKSTLNYSFPIKLPTGDGMGIYSIHQLNDELFLVGGGSWKYPNNEFNSKVYSSAWLINKDLNSKQLIKASDLSSYQYISGITGYFNGSKDLTWIAGGTKGILSNNQIINNATQSLKNVNAVSLSKNYLWIIGSKNQHIRIPLLLTE